MSDPWNPSEEVLEIDALFFDLEYHPEKMLTETTRNTIYELLKDDANNDYRIDFIRSINDFPELNNDSHIQQQVVKTAILHDLYQKDWLERLGQYVDGRFSGNTHWDEIPGYHELETDDEALTQFRQQLYQLLS